MERIYHRSAFGLPQTWSYHALPHFRGADPYYIRAILPHFGTGNHSLVREGVGRVRMNKHVRVTKGYPYDIITTYHSSQRLPVLARYCNG